MSLLDLDEDLFYCIALVFERDRTTLRALAQVCRVFYCAAQSVLYRHIGQISIEQNAMLHRTFSEKPHLRAYVHSTSVSIVHGKIQNDGLSRTVDYQSLREITFIGSKKLKPVHGVGGMESLRNRQNQLRDGRDRSQDFQCGFLDTHQFSTKIRTICLVGNFTTTEIMRFLFLPNVQCLKAQDISILRAPQLSSTTRNLNLTTLSLTGDVLWSIEPHTMQSICLACPLLQKLSCQVPMTTIFSGHLQKHQSRVTVPVSPATLDAVFEPLRGSLRHLSLLQLRHDVPYDGTHMDLSGFTKLTDLEITSCCLLPPGPPCQARNTLYELLPLSLINLSLNFPRESGIFYHHLEGEPFLTQDISSIPESRYNWICHLLVHKGEHFPDLSDVRMQDPPGTVGFWYWKEAEWDMSKNVKQQAHELGVSLKVNIAYPHPQSEVDTYNQRRSRPRYGFFPWD